MKSKEIPTMNIGQKVLFELKKEISQTEYERYIKKLVYDAKRSRSNLVYFNAPNMLIAKWIKTKYADKIAHLFELQNEVKPEIKITVGKQKNQVTAPLNVATPDKNS